MIGKVLFDEMRDRRQIKNKYKREEKENPWAVEAAMNRRDPMPTPPTSSPSTDGDGGGGRLLTSVDDGEGFAAEDPEPEEWTVAAVVGEAQEDMVMEKGQEQNLEDIEDKDKDEEFVPWLPSIANDSSAGMVGEDAEDDDDDDDDDDDLFND